MTARRRGGPRLSAPLAILTGIVVTVAIGHLLTVLILAAAAGLAAGTAYAAGARRARRRPAVTLRARPASPSQPAPHKRATGRPPGPEAPPDELAALRATLRARADRVSQRVPPPAGARERSS